MSETSSDEHPDQEKQEGTLAAGLALAVGIGLGLWLDASVGSSPWGLLAGILLGSVAAVVSVVQQIRRFL